MGNVLLGNRGSGKLADAEAVDARAGAELAASASMAKRLVILQHARFGAIPTGGRRTGRRQSDRRIWELYAKGDGTKRIASALRLGRKLVRRRIAEIWRVHGHLIAPPGLAALVRECEPGTLALFFGLLRRAIDEPAEVEEMLRAAEAAPELRALMEEP